MRGIFETTEKYITPALQAGDSAKGFREIGSSSAISPG